MCSCTQFLQSFSEEYLKHMRALLKFINVPVCSVEYQFSQFYMALSECRINEVKDGTSS